MTKRIFTPQAIKQLQANRNVKGCTPKSITYHEHFKHQALRDYQEEYHTPQEIFIHAGFDLDVIGAEVPKQCLARWKRSGTGDKRGRRKKQVFTSKDAEIAYLRAENSFLKQLRAKRAEQYSRRKKSTRSLKNSPNNIQ